jgi:hypothetical protein
MGIIEPKGLTVDNPEMDGTHDGSPNWKGPPNFPDERKIPLSEPVDIKDVLNTGRFGGSDQAFLDQAAKAYDIALKKYGAENVVEKMTEGFEDAVKKGKLDKEVAEIYIRALRDSNDDAQTFAKNLQKDRDQLAGLMGKESNPGNMMDGLKDNPMVMMMMVIMAKMFGVDLKQFGLGDPFANASGRPPSASATPAPVVPPNLSVADIATLPAFDVSSPSMIPIGGAATFSVALPPNPLRFDFITPFMLTEQFGAPANPPPQLITQINPFVDPSASAGNDEVYRIKAQANGLGV